MHPFPAMFFQMSFQIRRCVKSSSQIIEDSRWLSWSRSIGGVLAGCHAWCTRKGWGSWAPAASGWEGLGHFSLLSSATSWGKTEPGSSQGSERIRGNEDKLQKGKFWLHVRKNILPIKVVVHWKRCPGRLQYLHPWRCSKLSWTQPWVAWSNCEDSCTFTARSAQKTSQGPHKQKPSCEIHWGKERQCRSWTGVKPMTLMAKTPSSVSRLISHPGLQ